MPKNSPKKPQNIALIVGICVPLAMILFVAASIYLPSFFVQPQFDFIYSNELQKYNMAPAYPVKEGQAPEAHPYESYDVKGNRVIKVTLSWFSDSQVPENKLYYYDVKANEARVISFEEAAKYNLITDSKSPDGFEVTYGTRDGGMFPLFSYSSSDYEARYLKGNNVSKKLNIQTVNTGSGYMNFRFLGWVQK
jgi:hypothetical protein